MHHFLSSCRLSAPLSHTSSPGGLRHAAKAAKQLPYALQQQVNACPAAAAASSCTQCLQLPTWGLLHARPLTHEDFQVPSNVPCALVTPDKELARSGVQSRRPCKGDTFLESCFGTLWVHIHSHIPRICSPSHPPGVLWVHSHSCVPKHGLRPRGGNHNLTLSTLQGVRKRGEDTHFNRLRVPWHLDQIAPLDLMVVHLQQAEAAYWGLGCRAHPKMFATAGRSGR